MFSYRGYQIDGVCRYGLSEGSPFEAGIKLDADAALSFAREKTPPGIPLVAFGQSIGGAVAIDCVCRSPRAFSAVLLENTFTSMRSLIPQVFPLVGPFAFLCSEKWDSLERIREASATDSLKHVSFLFLAGAQDTMIPLEHMQGLWQALTSSEPASPASSSSYDALSESWTVWQAPSEDAVRQFTLFARGDHNTTSFNRAYASTVIAFLAPNVHNKEAI